MPSCFVPDCHHHSETSACQFFLFPQDEKRRKQWEALVRRGDRTPDESSRVCSCHFRDANPYLLPSIFERNLFKRMEFVSPEKRTRKKRRGSAAVSILNSTSEEIIMEAENTDASTPSAPRTYEFSSVFHESEKYLLQKEIEDLKKEIQRLSKRTVGFSEIQKDDKKCLYYTGLQFQVFELLAKICSTLEFKYCHGRHSVVALSFNDQLLLTLMKLRLNSTYVDLAWRFGVSTMTAWRIVNTFIPLLHRIVYQAVMEKMPSRKKNINSLPIVFASFTACRVVLDCTEMRCEIPHRMDHQRQTYSSYKHFNTLKVLIGVAPNATVTFCSSCYPGSTSDKQIVEHSGVAAQLESGDMILADKGFIIADLLPPDICVNIPPFLCNAQFTPSEISRTRSIAKARIHVERVNNRMKNYKITECFPRLLYSKASMIVQVCVGLINFQNPLLKEMEHDFHAVQENTVDEERNDAGDNPEENVADKGINDAECSP